MQFISTWVNFVLALDSYNLNIKNLIFEKGTPFKLSSTLLADICLAAHAHQYSAVFI